MGLREKLEKRIEEKRAEISHLEGRAKDAKIYLQALEDTIRLLPREPDDRDTVDATLRPGTNIDKAREVLKAAGRPIHITELLGALGKPGDNTNRAALSGSISAYVRKGQIFTRPAPNTFGLIEFAAKPSGPPENFGREESEPEPSDSQSV